jgi:hypothetical protein
MDDKIYPKNPHKFLCENCDYITSNKKDYDKHVLTLKHKKRTNGGQTDDVFTPNHIFNCECGKEYKHRQGLWKHKKLCEYLKNPENPETLSLLDEQTEINILTQLVKDVVKQNQELTNKLVDICKNSNTNISNNNINSHNKTFNLNVFLNETCKDAMNIMDFVNSLKLQLNDLENVGKIGFIEGISNIIIKNLNSLDENKRPVHCTDAKREVMYVKDEDKWEKENEDKQKLRKAIKGVVHKNSKLLNDFRAKHPDCGKSDSRYSDQYNKLVVEAFGGKGDNESEKEDKIIHNIAKIVTIDK